MKRGSLTPFCALVLMIITSLLLVLLEYSRVHGLERYAQMKADTAADSLCAEFQPYLWQEYGILFLNGAYGTETFSEVFIAESLENHLKENCAKSKNMGFDLFELKPKEVLLEGYALATDREGEVFLNYIAQRQMENLPLGMAEDLYQKYQQVERLDVHNSKIEEVIQQAQSTLAEVKTSYLNLKERSSIEDTSTLDSILGNAAQMHTSKLLNKIFGEEYSISLKSSELSSKLRSRKKEEGTLYVTSDRGWYRKMLILDYLEEYFTNYCRQDEEHFLSYEMEYVLCGEETEWENLEGALRKILLVREAANIFSLLQDEKKMGQVEELAKIAGLLSGGNSVVVNVVQAGIIGAWSYMESILDVRSLVFGEVIPLIKQANEWTSDITNLESIFDETLKAKTCEKGLDYTDYLQQILFMTGDCELAYRMMEVMEIGLQQQKKCENARMDHMLAVMRFKVSFESKPLFSTLISLGDIQWRNYIFTREIERSYVP